MAVPMQGEMALDSCSPCCRFRTVDEVESDGVTMPYFADGSFIMSPLNCLSNSANHRCDGFPNPKAASIRPCHTFVSIIFSYGLQPRSGRGSL
jgi:hypothetical protein